MRKILITITTMLVFGLLMAACNGGAAATPDAAQAAAQVATQVAQTIAAISSQQQQAAPTSTPGSIPTLDTAPTTAPLVPTLVMPPTATTTSCNPPPLMISESPTDSASYPVNTAFTKTWTIKNMGTCTWNSNYKIIYEGGDAMSGLTTMKFPGSAAPNETVTLSLGLTSNSTPGTYIGYWGLWDDKNVRFGRIWVKINVTSSTSTGGTQLVVTSVNVSGGDQPAFPCVATYGGSIDFQAYITTNAGGTVYYKWRVYHGGTTPIYESASSLVTTYNSAGSNAVNVTLTPPFVVDPVTPYSIRIFIVDPNHQEFTGVSITCTS